jgi:flagellar hook-associated protein 1 FlgK
MSSLVGIMSMAVRALLAEQGALDATSNNISNINTPGYSRQRPILVEGDPIWQWPLTFGSGVVLEKVESVRDPVLELRIHAEKQQQSRLEALVTGMSQTELMFSGSSGDIGDSLSKFFNSLQQLSTDPTSIPLRQGVLTAAGNLASAFRSVVRNIQQQRSNLDRSVEQAVREANTITGQIAKLNLQVTTLENLHQDASAFVDRRNVLIGQLSQLIDVSVIRSDNTITLTTANGTALVAGERAFQLDTHADSSGVQHIFAEGTDITGTIVGGKLAGLLDIRDRKLPSIIADLDTLAAGLASSMNSVHRAGFDLNGLPGGDLFAPPPAGIQGAAASFAVQITDPALLAASSDLSSGNNANLLQLLAVRNQAVVGGETPLDFYANTVFKVGNEVASNSAAQDASSLILQQLENQRSSISGVSLDEEAANLLRYQHAFEAAARVVSTISEVMDVAVNLGRY